MRYAVMVIGILSAANDLAAQSLESRIASARGSVTFQYETRPNVCGNGSSINVSDDSSSGWTYRSTRRGVSIGRVSGDGYERCELGPAHVLLRRSGSKVTELDVSVGGRIPQADTDLGNIPPADAARYLLALAPELPGKSGDEAVLGAEIADGVVVWRDLLKIAQSGRASESSRKASLFWLSHEATAAAVAGVDSIATDDDATLSIRSDALFYLAQRPNGEGIPTLVKVAESSKSMKLRKDAIFFLAQSGDERALTLFERLLSGR